MSQGHCCASCPHTACSTWLWGPYLPHRRLQSSVILLCSTHLYIYSVCVRVICPGLPLQSTAKWVAQTIEIYCFIVLKAGSLKPQGPQGWFFLRAVGEGCVPGLSHRLVDGCLFLLSSYCPPSNYPLFVRKLLYWIGAHPNGHILTVLPLERPCLQIRSHSEVLVVRPTACIFGVWGVTQVNP